MRKWLATGTAMVMALTILAGCGGAKKTEEKPAAPAPTQTESKPAAPAPAPATPFRVGMATDLGGLNDDSFNAAAWRGLQKVQSDLKGEVKAIESKRQEDYETNFQALIDLKYDVIWGIGFLMTDAVDKSSKKLPNQKFALIDGVVNNPNVASVVFKEEEGSFLVGMLAAKTTKTKKVGFVGGMDVDVIHHFEAGFKAGVMAADPSVEVISVYSGSFVDPAKGKEVALSMISQGADVIFHASGATGQGVIEAVKEKDKLAIGVDSDQKKLAPNHVLSSMMKRVDVAVFEVSKMAKEGTFPGGKVTVMGLKENGVGYSDTTMWEKAPAGTKDLVDKWAKAIKDGKVNVPNNRDKLKGWKVPSL